MQKRGGSGLSLAEQRDILVRYAREDQHLAIQRTHDVTVSRTEALSKQQEVAIAASEVRMSLRGERDA